MIKEEQKIVQRCAGFCLGTSYVYTDHSIPVITYAVFQLADQCSGKTHDAWIQIQALLRDATLSSGLRHFKYWTTRAVSIATRQRFHSDADITKNCTWLLLIHVL